MWSLLAFYVGILTTARRARLDEIIIDPASSGWLPPKWLERVVKYSMSVKVPRNCELVRWYRGLDFSGKWSIAMVENLAVENHYAVSALNGVFFKQRC